MSLIGRSKLKQGLIALAIMTPGILLAAPAAQARVGIGINLGFPPVIVPPVVVAPPVVAAPPVVVAPPAASGPPAYYALPPGYCYAPGYYYPPAPGYGVFWFDRSGHRYWRR